MCEENWFMIDPLRKQVKECLGIYRSSCRTLLDNCKLETIADIEEAVGEIVSYRETVDSCADFLKNKMAMYNARRDAPQRAYALGVCDEILTKLDSIRDIIARSIQGDEDVVCTETSARSISDFLKGTIDILPLLQETAYVLEGKR